MRTIWFYLVPQQGPFTLVWGVAIASSGGNMSSANETLGPRNALVQQENGKIKALNTESNAGASTGACTIP